MLNEKQKNFIREYMVDLNATQAAIRAGYSAKAAHSCGPRLLANAEVFAELQRLLKGKSVKLDITAQSVLKELHNLATVDVEGAYDKDGNIKPIDQIPENIRRSIAAIEVFEEYQGAGADRQYIGRTKRIRFWDKTKSLELLGKYLKLFTEKFEVTGQNGGPLLVAAETPEEKEARKKRIEEMTTGLKQLEGK